VAYSAATLISDTGLLSVRVSIINMEDDTHEEERAFKLLSALDPDQ
jgi:hypothetical protein